MPEILETVPAAHTEQPEPVRLPVQSVCRPHEFCKPEPHLYTENPATGAFIAIVDRTNNTVGAGDDRVSAGVRSRTS